MSVEDGRTESSRPSPAATLSTGIGRRGTILVFTGLFLAVLMFGLDGLIVATALPTIASSLGQAGGVAFVVGAYLIAVTISAPIFGRLSDLRSRKTVFLGGLVAFLVGSALAGISQNLDELILFRGVQGFGAGAFLPVGLAIVTDMFPPATRSRATGVLSGAGGISIVVGPLIGSYIVDVTTWRWIFYVNLPVGLAALVTLSVALKAFHPAAVGRFDLAGAGLMAGWVGTLMFPLVQVSDAGWAWTDARVLGLLVVSAALFAAFVAWELRTPDPVVPLRFLGHRLIAANGGLAVLNSVIYTAATTLLSVFVGVVLLGGNASAANDVRDVLYWFAIPTILGAVFAGQLFTKFSYRAVMVPAMVISIVGGFFLAGVTSSAPLWEFQWGFVPVGGIVLPLVPLGLGTGIVLTGSFLVVQNESPSKEIGASLALFSFLKNLGGAVGLSFLVAFETWRFDALAPSPPSSSGVQSALVTSYQNVFEVMLGLILVAFLLSLVLSGRIQKRAEGTSGQP
jgi:EmrB/QacA subfamily drug resistance transporter